MPPEDVLEYHVLTTGDFACKEARKLAEKL